MSDKEFRRACVSGISKFKIKELVAQYDQPSHKELQYTYDNKFKVPEKVQSDSDPKETYHKALFRLKGKLRPKEYLSRKYYRTTDPFHEVPFQTHSHDCADEENARWLTENVSNLRPWEGTSLVALDGRLGLAKFQSRSSKSPIRSSRQRTVQGSIVADKSVVWIFA